MIWVLALLSVLLLPPADEGFASRCRIVDGQAYCSQPKGCRGAGISGCHFLGG